MLWAGTTLTRVKLEKMFTYMLMRVGADQAYFNLTAHYLRFDTNTRLPINSADRQRKIEAIKHGDPRKWITEVFSEGLEMPPLLGMANSMWQAKLTEEGYP